MPTRQYMPHEAIITNISLHTIQDSLHVWNCPFKGDCIIIIRTDHHWETYIPLHHGILTPNPLIFSLIHLSDHIL
jgi:hypothetical protein